MTDKIKQNKKYFYIIPFIAILFLFLYIPSYADNDPVLINQYIPNDTSDLALNGTYMGIWHAGGRDYNTYFSSSEANTYVFKVNSDTYICAPTQGTICYNTDTRTLLTNSLLTYNTAYELYWYTVSWPNQDVVCPIYTDPNDGFIAVANLIEGSGAIPKNITFSLPAGNVAYVDLGESSTLYGVSRIYHGNAYFNQLSNIFNGQFDFDNGKWGYSSSIPSTGSNLNIPTNNFEFAKTGKTNLVGQSHNGYWSQTSTATSRYLVLYNPLYYTSGFSGASVDDAGEYSVTLSFTIPNAYNVTVLPLTTSISVINGNGTSTEETGDPKTGVIDDDGNVIGWVDSNDEPTTEPSYGGNNSTVTDQTSVVGWLKQIAGDVVAFLNRSVGSISVLVNGGAAFFTHVSDLYNWLPSQVYSVIVSAITIVFAIGVIKVFL